MRITQGIYNHRIINSRDSYETRPTSDKARQALFNILRFDVNEATFLDLFAGSGAIGIEALSAKAKFVTFIDFNKESCDMIISNLNSLKVDPALYEIINNDYTSISSLNRKYDIIFLDPPYKLDCFKNVFEIINKNDLLTEKGIIVYESNEEFKINDSIEGFSLKQYKYGIAYMNVLRKIK